MTHEKQHEPPGCAPAPEWQGGGQPQGVGGCGSTVGCGQSVYGFQISNSGISISRVRVLVPGAQIAFLPSTRPRDPHDPHDPRDPYTPGKRRSSFPAGKLHILQQRRCKPRHHYRMSCSARRRPLVVPVAVSCGGAVKTHIGILSTQNSALSLISIRHRHLRDDRTPRSG